MRAIILIVFLLSGGSLFSQDAFPEFLAGTWKVSGKETYEHWNKTEPFTMKGMGFKMRNGLPEVTEYIELKKEGVEVFLVATVPTQNNGKSIRFKLTGFGERYTFENPKHDFPQKIVYRPINDGNVQVILSGKGEGQMTYTLERVNASKLSEATANTQYDEVLAKRLEADDYGMKSYWFVILKTGLNTTAEKEFITESFRGHMANMGKMVEEGKLIVAGPMMKNDKTYRGIFILNDPGSEEEIKQMLQTDPAIKAGLLDAEIYKWYGSAALPEYLKAADKIWKSKP
jgi:uncharacterized protein YciI